ncbi:MAG: hypothetical protein B7Z08_07650 [Sphingomonadales bacterium 32-68-7]|nr:MAG: hypothetical protein B7Z08_07650 [Sphingomonadales bacterium 32-68-7]
MRLAARLSRGETLGDRIIKVDHAGEHGAVCIYSAQRWFATWRAPDMLDEIEEFIAHERGHRARSRRSYGLCGLGGLALGAATGLAGRQAIAATTVAIERVVLRHMHEQIDALEAADPRATDVLRQIVVEEQEHHDLSKIRLAPDNLWSKLLDPIVSASTEVVIWLGMRL